MRYTILIVFSLIAQSVFAQLTFTSPIPKYGCPNTTHSVTIGVTSSLPVPSGTAITATVTIKDNTNANTLGTSTQTITTTGANTIYVTIPSVAFAGPMECNVSGSASFTLFGTPTTVPITSTYTVQYPPVLTISEDPVATIKVLTNINGYSVRYFLNGNYDVTKDDIYTPAVGGTYTAKATEVISMCTSSSFSNELFIKVIPTLTFPEFDAFEIGDPDYLLNATSTNDAVPITYISGDPAVATIVDGKIHITGVGTTMITAQQTGDETHITVTATRTLTVKESTPTAVNNVLHASISAYPNPSSEQVLVKLENTNANTAVGILTDAMGAEITHVNFYQTGRSLEASIDVQALTKGMYILRIQSDKGIASTKVFVK